MTLTRVSEHIVVGHHTQFTAPENVINSHLSAFSFN